MWAQRAWVRNILYKDLDTRYFHMLAKIHQLKHHTTMLKDSNGHWVKDPDLLSQLISNHFINSFKLWGLLVEIVLGPFPCPNSLRVSLS